MNKYIVGSIKKIIFESNNSPYKVGLFKVKDTNDEDMLIYKDKVIGFTGSFMDINNEVDYIFYGKMVNHPKYGTQYSVDSYEISIPSDTDSLILYLSSGMFKGIGLKTAKKIVERFGSDTLDVIKNDYESLALVSSMNMKKALMIHNKVMDSEYNQDLIIKLNGYGFSVKEAINLSTIYGSELLNIIESDVYELLDYVSFDKLDLIFLSLYDEFDERRIRALIKHNIYIMCYESGDTFVSKEDLFIKMKRCFKDNFSADSYITYLDKSIESADIIEINDYVCLYEFYDTETSIIKDINRFNGIKNIIDEKKINKYITKYEKENNIKFNDEQKDAIKGAIIYNFYIITGGPGTGKTTIIKAIVNILEDLCNVDKKDIALLAPTGRSAKRINESVSAPSYTIHKFLKWNKESESFGIDEYNKAHEKVIIVDESSMIDIFLFNSLLKGLRINAKLLLIGDANQLPSIGPGDILNDLLSISDIKKTTLNKIYRVKEGSYITYLANDIKNVKHFDTIDNNYSDFKFIESSDTDIKEYLSKICENIIKKGISVENFQVLVPMYKGINGIDSLNEMMANIFNPNQDKYQIGDKYFRVGDKVIQLINDVENNVFNGDIGYIKRIDSIDRKLVVTINFMGNNVIYKSGEFDRFTLAYAISIHKSQGSEYDNVVIVLASSFKRMFYNKLIYTAVTRAKSSLIILGSLDSFNSSVKTLYANDRITLLKMNKK